MKKINNFQVFTSIWLIAVFVLATLLWRNVGDARILNYSGIIRGATQRLVKEELNGEPDDQLLQYLDDVLYDLQTGDGDYGIRKNEEIEYQQLLEEVKVIWENLKTEILLARENQVNRDRVYEISQEHFEVANQMVFAAEHGTEQKLFSSIAFYMVCLVLSIGIFAFVSRRSKKELEYSRSYDKLTGLLNRHGFEAEAIEILRKNPDKQFTVIEFDIDNFKIINDICGFREGDRFLCAIAQQISLWRDQVKVCARINADDFLILAEKSDTLVLQLQKRLNELVEEQTFLKPLGGATFSYGVCEVNNTQDSIKTIMDNANTAHKNAKNNNLTKVVWYNDELLDKLKKEKTYQDQMHHGLAKDEFKLYLQPKVNLSTMEVIGAEALVRWKLQGIHLLYPDSFIPLFEKNGYIVDLDFYMLGKVCQLLRKRLDAGKTAYVISVNFSRVTLYQPNFQERVLNVVDSYEIPHGYIEIEVTESAFNRIENSVIQILQGLRDEGFCISMDDFGSGYSNLSLLGKLPIHMIKLDREFLRSMDDEQESMKRIINSVVNLAHTMGIKIICEGAEQEAHINFLKSVGCDYVQGYYFSKPIPQEEFEEKYEPTKEYPGLEFVG